MPDTAAPPVTRSVTVVPLIVLGFIASLNFTVIALDTETLTAPFAGTLDVTVGGVASAVVKLAVNCDAREFPAKSLTDVLTVKV